MNGGDPSFSFLGLALAFLLLLGVVVLSVRYLRSRRGLKLLLVLVILLIVLVFISLGFGVLGTFLVLIGGALSVWYVRRRRGLKRLQDTPAYVQRLTNELKAVVTGGTDAINAAEAEFSAGRAPLFWDCMESFSKDTCTKFRALWRDAADRAELYNQAAPRNALGPPVVIEPDQSVSVEYVALMSRWKDLYLRAMGDSHFAHIFETRRQTDRVVEGQRLVREELEETKRAAQSAERAAYGAADAARDATRAARGAAGAARGAEGAARSITWRAFYH